MAKYINTAMAIEALEKGLDVWIFESERSLWNPTNIGYLIADNFKDSRFAIGEKPTSPPRKMIKIDGVRMPAPITQKDAEAIDYFAILEASGAISVSRSASLWPLVFVMGNCFATEADAIAARDARKLILELAMERAK